jgi:hypothetical protein
MEDTLPNGMGFVSGAGTGWTCAAGAQNAQLVTYTIPGPIGIGANSTIAPTISLAPVVFPSVTNAARATSKSAAGSAFKV